jgi:hypothetical protein
MNSSTSSSCKGVLGEKEMSTNLRVRKQYSSQRGAETSEGSAAKPTEHYRSFVLYEVACYWPETRQLNKRDSAGRGRKLRQPMASKV